MAARSRKPLPPPPGSGAPGPIHSRPIPPPPVNDEPAAPPLPSRPIPRAGAVPPPGKSPHRPPPPPAPVQQDEYEDPNSPQETYDDLQDVVETGSMSSGGSAGSRPPPLPPHPEPEQETYDDLEDVVLENSSGGSHRDLPPPPLPGGRPRLSEPEHEPEEYDAILDVKPMARNDNPDINVYELDEPPAQQIQQWPDQTYEAMDDLDAPPSNSSGGSMTSAGYPRPPPVMPPTPPQAPSPRVPAAPDAPPVPAMPQAIPRDSRPNLPQRNEPPAPRKPPLVDTKQPGGGASLNDIMSGLAKLKKVNPPAAKTEQEHEPKLYGEIDESDIKSKFLLFKQKEKAAGAIRPAVPLKPVTPPTKQAIKPNTPLNSATKNGLQHHSDASENSSSSPTPPALPPRPADLESESPPPPPIAPSIDSIPSKKKELPVPDEPVRPPVTPQIQQRLPSPEPTEDEIYDEAFSAEIDPLQCYDWYQGLIERKQGERMLHNISENGGYLVRKSQKGGDSQPFTLAVMYNDHVYNLKIRERKDKRYALGEDKADEITFKDVPALISHHKTNDVILVHKSGQKYKTVLLVTPHKPGQ